MSVALAAIATATSAAVFAQGPAPSASVRECAQAYESSQDHRRADALSLARSEFARCARDDCPEFIRTDCTRWSKEAAVAQPSVVFTAKRGDRDLNDVRVSLADRVMLERLPGQAVELDPGSYDLQFETSGSAAITRHVVVRAGDKDLLVQVEFPAAAERRLAARAKGASAASVARSAAAERRSTALAASDGPRVLPWTLLALGAASLGTGVGLSVWGRSDENQLRDSCAPNCTDAQVKAVHTKYVLGDLSVGVGLLSVSLAAYLFVSDRDSERATSGALPLSVVPGPRGALAVYGARF